MLAAWWIQLFLGVFHHDRNWFFSETAGIKWQADAIWYIYASDQPISIASLPVRNCSKQSHYTTAQGLPLYLCNVFHFSLLHDPGLPVTFQNMLPSLQTMRDFPSNLFFTFTVPFLFAEEFHAFEGCNPVASWFLAFLGFFLWTTTVLLIFP